MTATRDIVVDQREKYAFRDEITYLVETRRGLSRDVVEEISRIKGEPDWMRQFRLRAYDHFVRRPMPTWGGDLSKIDFDRIVYYRKPHEREERSWDDVPEQIKRTFERLGIPEAERKFLAGVGAQYDSEVVYHSVREELARLGVVFMGTDQGLKEYPEIFRKYFGTVVPPEDNKFAALNSAVWSGGSFVYVPKGVEVPLPLQAYFRINAENTGQFERTLIVVDEGAKVHYIEGCTAPIYATDALHAAVVEVIALPGAKVRYTTIQNWSNDVYNLVTKRAHAYEGATVEWVDANTGCLTGDTAVFANSDVVPIAALEPGRKVYSLGPDFSIERRPVVATRKNEPGPVFELRLANDRRVRATPNHPFLVARTVGGTRRIAWLPLASIVEGDEVAVSGRLPDDGRSHRFEPIPRRPRARSPFSAPEVSSPDLLWLLGFFLGDGRLEGGGRVVFAVPETDPAADRVADLALRLFGVRVRRHGAVLRASSAAWVDWLTANGFGGAAGTRSVPAWVFRLPEAEKRAFIEGYLAADGRLRAGRRSVSVTSADRELLEQVRLLAIAAGLEPGKLVARPGGREPSAGSEERADVRDALEFGEGAPDAPVHFVPVAGMTYLGEQETYDIEVEGTANFIADGVFVHNSRLTMKYPSIYLRGEGATAEIISVAVAGKGQHQDTGAKAIHLAPNTRSRIVSKSVSKDGGRTTYRGHLKVAPGATGVVASVRCDALMLDDVSRSDTYPYIDIQEDDTTMTHEATVGKISQDQVFYLMTRGLTENEATNLIVQGFLEVFTKELPMEYAIEFNRLVKLEMEGSLG
ncbi:MAG TPA: Fe-S cluster assembly protein SufB [Candidatus Limnocylindrales bacterium]|nr:Fe-S cluster assembly protein SufB [Candidatus Limnocylindrales bacterium]